MEIRKVKQVDIPQIRNLYKVCFGKEVSEEIYNWYYYHKNYCSYVMLNDNMIIAHQAIIEVNYTYERKSLNIGLLSGTMILPEYQKSGDFYYILKDCLSGFAGDIIIGFPNKKFQGILNKIFSFKNIPDNLFQLDLTKNLKYVDEKIYCNFLRDDLSWRIDRHPFNAYFEVKNRNCKIICKEYSGNSIDILFTNVIDKDFIDILAGFSQKYKSINIISIHSELLERIGFVKIDGNEFIYKAYNSEYENVIFPCQMIDSDIY